MRLVRSAPEPLGPISPELVLVSPELAALVAGTPDAVVVDENPDQPGDAEPEQKLVEETRTQGGSPTGTVRYDTSDLVLERHGLTLELESRGELRLWRLTLPRGEKIEMPAAPSGVPRRIAALLDTLLGDDELRRVPARSASPEIQRLEAQLLAQRRSLVAHDAGTRLAVDAENLHQLRVASRRVRAFLRVARRLWRMPTGRTSSTRRSARSGGRAATRATSTSSSSTCAARCPRSERPTRRRPPS